MKECNSLKTLAINLQNTGVKLIFLECVKDFLAKDITSLLKIPTIGIGSSHHCDGQVLVINDLLNLDIKEKKPKFVKSYANLYRVISLSVNKFTKEVINKKFPNKKHSYKL